MAKHTPVDAVSIEQHLLELAYTSDVKITAPTLAYVARCSIDDAASVLEELAAHDRVRMEVEDDGSISYHVPGRHRLAKPAEAPAPASLAFARIARKPQREASPLAAALLSALVPGAGHLYAGRVVAAILWFFVVSAGYVLILPGLVLHLFNIASSATATHRLNAASARLQLAAA